jgi:hypothetical protein
MMMTLASIFMAWSATQARILGSVEWALRSGLARKAGRGTRGQVVMLIMSAGVTGMLTDTGNFIGRLAILEVVPRGDDGIGWIGKGVVRQSERDGGPVGTEQAPYVLGAAWLESGTNVVVEIMDQFDHTIGLGEHEGCLGGTTG